MNKTKPNKQNVSHIFLNPHRPKSLMKNGWRWAYSQQICSWALSIIINHWRMIREASMRGLLMIHHGGGLALPHPPGQVESRLLPWRRDAFGLLLLHNGQHQFFSIISILGFKGGDHMWRMFPISIISHNFLILSCINNLSYALTLLTMIVLK